MEKSKKTSFLKNLPILALLCGLFVVSSCTKDDDSGKSIETDPNSIRMLITSEGQFGYATASLTAITYGNTVTNDLFRTVNNRPLGDVAQSMTEVGDNYYVAVSNSKKIEVFNKKTFLSVETIPTQNSPRYMVYLGNDRMMVSDKGTMNLLINVKTKEQQKITGVEGTAQMKTVGNKLFLSGNHGLRVMDIDKIAENKVREIKNLETESIVTCQNAKIVQDKSGKLWVLAPSSYFVPVAKLICIDPTTEKVVKEIAITNIAVNDFARLDISPDGEYLYYTGSLNNEKGIMQMHINALS
ncbi:MAG: hypothetical protein RR550_02245, partial [Rikenellaceae bacterium]